MEYDNSLVAMNADQTATISVIIPVWRNGDGLLPLVRDLKSWPHVREVIVSVAEPAPHLRPELEKAGATFLNNTGPNRGHPRLRFLEPLERWHSRAFGTIYGDQSIFVRREHFLKIGGFAELPLMEDVDLSRRLRSSGKIKLLDPPIRSCARRQIAQGPWKVTLRNLLFLILFRCGVPVRLLHSWYYGFRRESGGTRDLFPVSPPCRLPRAVDTPEN